jgi:TolA-binding protein
MSLLALLGCVSTAEPSKAYQALWDRGTDELTNKKDYAAARSTFRELLERFPQGSWSQDARLFLADSEFELGNEPEARKLREQVAKEATSSEVKVRALSGLGMQELTRENFEVAAHDFEEAAKLEPDPRSRALLIVRRGLALQRAGRFAEARELYRQAIVLAPGSRAEKLAKPQLLLPDYFFVPAGAYREEANAERQRKTLAEKGFPAEVAPLDTASGKLYRVRVGRFADRASARALAQKLRDSKVLPEMEISVRP